MPKVLARVDIKITEGANIAVVGSAILARE
jgi:hypothetical protein